MLKPRIRRKNDPIFETFRHIDQGGEYWYAREINHHLDNEEWETTLAVIEAARKMGTGVDDDLVDHFARLDDHSYIDTGPILDFRLTRQACATMGQVAWRRPGYGEFRKYFVPHVMQKRDEDDPLSEEIRRVFRLVFVEVAEGYLPCRDVIDRIRSTAGNHPLGGLNDGAIGRLLAKNYGMKRGRIIINEDGKEVYCYRRIDIRRAPLAPRRQPILGI